MDTFEMTNLYQGPPNYELREVAVTVHVRDRVLTATGVPLAWVPLRHPATRAGRQRSHAADRQVTYLVEHFGSGCDGHVRVPRPDAGRASARISGVT